MSVKIKLNLPLQKLAENREAMVVNGATVRQCLEDLINRLPGARQHIFYPDGSLAVLFLLNNEPLPRRALEHTVKEGDELWILSLIAGG